MALALVFIFHSFCLAAPGHQKGNNEARILWAFGAIRASSNPAKVEPVSNQMVLKSGDKLKMMIQIRKKCFVYLIHKDSQGNFAMLFPYSLKQFDTDYQTARNYYSPKGKEWFQLDNRPGNETFYLIASDQRLLDIEYTYQKYASSEESRKQDLAGQILTTRRDHGKSPGIIRGRGNTGEQPARTEGIRKGDRRRPYGCSATGHRDFIRQYLFQNIRDRPQVGALTSRGSQKPRRRRHRRHVLKS